MNQNQIQKEIAGAFAGLVGQNRIVSNRILAHVAFAMGDDSPTSVLFTGAAGLGKTAMLRADLAARAIAVRIRRNREATTLFVRSPQDLRLAGDAYFQFVDAVQNDDGVTLDELHEIDQGATVQTKKVRAMIKGLLDREKGNNFRSVRLDDDTTISRHKSEIYFGAGTNYPEKIKDGPAILSRFGDGIPLELYSPDELTEILLLMSGEAGLRIHENTVSLIAQCGRGTARPLEHIVAHLSRVAVTLGKSTLNRADALDAMRALELYPFGVSAREVSILVRSRGAGIAARMLPIVYAIEPKAAGLSLAFLSSMGFVTIRAGVATLTTKGDAFLSQLVAEGFKLPK